MQFDAGIALSIYGRDGSEKKKIKSFGSWMRRCTLPPIPSDSIQVAEDGKNGPLSLRVKIKNRHH